MSVVITGSPGVGKHTVAQIVADMCGLQILDLNIIAAEAGAITHAGGAAEADTEALHDILVDIMAGRGGAGHLALGHLAPYVVPARYAGVAIVLRRDPYALEHTYMQRGYPPKKMLDNLQAEILGITYHDAARRFGDKTVQLDVSGRTAHETAKLISACSTGRIRPDERDWLGIIYERGDLARFFPTC